MTEGIIPTPTSVPDADGIEDVERRMQEYKLLFDGIVSDSERQRSRCRSLTLTKEQVDKQLEYLHQSTAGEPFSVQNEGGTHMTETEEQLEQLQKKKRELLDQLMRVDEEITRLQHVVAMEHDIESMHHSVDSTSSVAEELLSEASTNQEINKMNDALREKQDDFEKNLKECSIRCEPKKPTLAFLSRKGNKKLNSRRRKCSLDN